MLGINSGCGHGSQICLALLFFVQVPGTKPLRNLLTDIRDFLVTQESRGALVIMSSCSDIYRTLNYIDHKSLPFYLGPVFRLSGQAGRGSALAAKS